MSESAPMLLNGSKMKRDKTGLIRVSQLWEVFSIDDAITFEPIPTPYGLPVVDRDATEYVVGTWTLELTYEGGGADSVTFDTDAALEVEIDGTMDQDPIQSHPNFQALKSKYNWDPLKNEFGEYLSSAPANGSAPGNALGSPSNSALKPNPLHGVESYLVAGAIFRITYTVKNAPTNLLDGIGTVVDIPPGYELLGIPRPAAPRNWLKLAPRISRRGNATRIVGEHKLSGPHGWLTDVYGKSQLTAK